MRSTLAVMDDTKTEYFEKKLKIPIRIPCMPRINKVPLEMVTTIDVNLSIPLCSQASDGLGGILLKRFIRKSVIGKVLIIKSTYPILKSLSIKLVEPFISDRHTENCNNKSNKRTFRLNILFEFISRIYIPK